MPLREGLARKESRPFRTPAFTLKNHYGILEGLTGTIHNVGKEGRGTKEQRLR